jgi:hypothetical protein
MAAVNIKAKQADIQALQTDLDSTSLRINASNPFSLSLLSKS